MQDVLTVVRELPPVLVYLAAALLVATETAVIIGLVMPAEATLLAVGFLAYTGMLRLGPALVVMIVAAVLGDALAFRSGRRHGPRMRAGRWGSRVGERRWAKADAMLVRLGGRGVFAARWVAFARTLVPRLAGSAGMPYRRFAPWNLAGVVTWVGGSVLAGYLAGESYETVSHYLGKATGAVLLLIVFIVAIVLVGRWLGRNPDPVRSLLSRAVARPPLRWLARRYGVLFFLLSMHIGPGWTLLANLVAGLALLFVSGLALAWLLDLVITQSGLSVVDSAIAEWFASRRTDGVAELAHGAIGALRGPVLILVVALVAAVVGWRTRPWRADLLSVLGTVGAFVPLLVLVLVTDVTGPTSGAPVRLLPAQNAVVAASLCTLAWLLARQSRWPMAVAAWTVAAVGVVTVGAARLYVGWSSASETVTSMLLGVLWTAVFMVAWATRDRLVRAGRTSTGPSTANRPEPSADETLPSPAEARPSAGEALPSVDEALAAGSAARSPTERGGTPAAGAAQAGRTVEAP
ncbi:phospholipid phosphatase [Plantactinospora sp. BB1]|nr:DedA family protein [Plantactinospora sp. BB1]AVT40985.1 phospholipid phosphatase [Plantactinospora sp. BB1]